MPRRYDEEMWDFMDDTPNRKLYPYNMVAVEGLRCFGWQELKRAGAGTPLHYHKDCFEIHYLYGGTLSFFVKGKEYALKAGDIFITYPNEYHGSGDNPFTGHKMYWFNLMVRDTILGLDEAWSRVLLEKLANIRHRVIPATEDMKYMIDQSFAHVLSDDPYYQRYANGQMLAFLQRLIENDAAMEQGDRSPEIEKAIGYMQNHLQEVCTLNKIADYVGLSLSYFKAKFKREVGISPADYYMDLRITKAKELLLSGKSVTDTAYELDFVFSNYFSVAFRRITSMTPTQFVKENREKR